jgi:hypothetical protein
VFWAVRVLVAWGINILALLVADWLFDGFTVERWGPIILAGAVLGLANVFLKPLVTFIAGDAGLLDRRLLDLRRRHDRDLARQLDRLDDRRRGRRGRRTAALVRIF